MHFVNVILFTSTALKAMTDMVDNVSTDFPSRIQKELALPKPVKSLKRATKRKNTERAVGPILKSTSVTWRQHRYEYDLDRKSVV